MILRNLGLLLAGAAALGAQTLSRRADIRGGDTQRGKCTIEVVVDGSAEVEIRGDNAILRNLNGQPPEWRRFVCNAPMPRNPGGFRFAGVDGRGRQDLLRGPGEGGPAVIRIEDPQNGSEGYTFDIFWNGGGGGYPGGQGGDGGYRPPAPAYGRDEAIRGCQDAISQQARDQFRGGNVIFRRIDIDDNPGRRDRVVGSIEVRRGNDRDRFDTYRFSCSVDFSSGRIRSANIEGVGERPPIGGGGGGNYDPSERALNNCRRGVQDRLSNDGFDRVDFNRIEADRSQGRRDLIVGDVRAEGRNGRRAFDFSCSVDFRDGDVRSVDVRRR